jgi:hypothetical protein
MNKYEDYPQTYEDFLEWFKTEEDCINYISKHRGKLFYRIIQQAVTQEAITMDEITGKKPKHNM